MHLLFIVLAGTLGLLNVIPMRAEDTTLPPGKWIDAVCSVKAPRNFSVKLRASMAVRILVDQKDADLMIRILPGKGRELRIIDSFDSSTETVSIVAATSGEYHLVIFPVRKDTGRLHFSIQMQAVHPAGPLDLAWVAAENLATDSKKSAQDRQDWEATLQLNNRSREAWGQLGQKDLVARTHLKSGDVYLDHGIRDLAHEEYIAAAKLCGVGQTLTYAEAINNAGTASLNLHNLESAKTELRSALDVWKSLNMPKMEGITHSNLGVVFTRQGDWKAALHEYDLAVQLLKSREPLRYAVVLNSIGLIRLSISSYAPAERSFFAALKIASRYPESPTIAGRILINLGRSRMFSGQLDAALKDQNDALRILENNADFAGVGDALNNIGQILLRKGDLTNAASVLKQAADRTKGDPRSHSSALHYLGVVAYQNGDVEASRDFLNQALAIRQQRAMLNEEAETQYQLAILERNANQRDESLRHAWEAIRLSEELRGQLSGEALRRFSAGRYQYSEFYVDTMLFDTRSLNYAITAGLAFNASERARAQSQADLLGEESSTLRGADPALLKRRAALQRRFSALSSRLAGLPESQDTMALASKLRSDIASVLAESNDVELLLRADNPAYQKSVDPRLVTVDEVRAELAEGDYLLEFALGEERSFLWIVTRESIRVEVLPARVEIERKARDLLDAFPRAIERRANAGKRAEWARQQRDLAATLHLKFPHNGRPKRVIVIPDGVLHYVPWAVLPVLSEGNMGPERALGLQYEVVQAPSASVFQLMEQRRRSQSGPISVSVIADPILDRSDARVPQGAKRAESPKIDPAGRHMARLTRWTIAIEPLLRSIPASRVKIFDSFRASKGVFFRKDVLHSSILVLWTHGVEDKQVELSRILLTRVNRFGEPLDGFIHLYDLFGVRMGPSLVILAACETSGGPSERGEAILGLARGFLEAGVTGLMTTSSTLDEESTSYFMKHFFDALMQTPGTSPSSALLAARRAMAEKSRWNDAYYWGSLTLISGVS